MSAVDCLWAAYCARWTEAHAYPCSETLVALETARARYLKEVARGN